MTDIEFSRPLKLDHIDRKGTKKSIEANTDECIALSKRFDLDSIDTLKADFDIKPSGLAYHVTGSLNAKANQISVISGDIIPTAINADIDTYLTDKTNIVDFDQQKEDEYEIKDEKDDPESIQNGEIDLGEIAAQFLGLSLDDYPRAEGEETGDYIEVKPEDAKPNPFAVLKDLKTK